MLCGSFGIACGQKGPPLAPIVLTPRAVTGLTAKRVENEVVLQFTVPTVNTDSSGPADLRRIEVYAHTGPLPAPADFLKYGTLVTRIEVRNPKEQRAESEEKSGATGASAQVRQVRRVRQVQRVRQTLSLRSRREMRLRRRMRSNRERRSACVSR